MNNVRTLRNYIKIIGVFLEQNQNYVLCFYKENCR